MRLPRAARTALRALVLASLLLPVSTSESLAQSSTSSANSSNEAAAAPTNQAADGVIKISTPDSLRQHPDSTAAAVGRVESRVKSLEDTPPRISDTWLLALAGIGTLLGLVGTALGFVAKRKADEALRTAQSAIGRAHQATTEASTASKKATQAHGQTQEALAQQQAFLQQQAAQQHAAPAQGYGQDPAATVAYGQGGYPSPHGGYAAAPTPPPVPAQLPAAEALGLAYAAWCTSGDGLMNNLGRFEATVRERYGLGVQVREVFRNCNAIGLEFGAQPFTDSAPYWVVETANEGTYLLPQPTNPHTFKEVHEGLFDAQAYAPAHLRDVRPAQVAVGAGGGLSILHRGRLS